MRSDSSLARSVPFPRVLNIEDLRRLARRRLPAVVFDYIDGGAEDEVTLARELPRVRDVTFRPRQCVAVPGCELRTTVLGIELALPFMLAPVGFCRMFYPRGEATPRARRAPPAPATSCRRSRARGSKRCAQAPAARSGTSSSAGRPRRRRSHDRARARRPATPRSSSRSTRRWPACASATSETA